MRCNKSFKNQMLAIGLIAFGAGLLIGKIISGNIFFFAIIVIAIGLVILLPYQLKRLRILYYIRHYTSDSFGGSCLYKWCWTKTSDKFNVYGYFPIRIDVVENVKLDPNIPTIDCAHHYIHNKNLLEEYIMICLYHKVENTKQTNLFVQQLHSLEAHYSSQNRR